MNLEQTTDQYRGYIEQFLTGYFRQFHAFPQSRLFEAMEYSIFAGGKRLRSIFTLEFCRLCGKDWKSAAPFAAAIEMIHTYSLIHDDLPCMDDDDFRRGIPTNHRVFGEATALLAGDALLTDAFGMAASCQLKNIGDMAEAITLLAECTGSRGMVGGQILDIDSENRVLTEQEVLDIQSRKTGALIRASCLLGVLAAGGSREQKIAADIFASNLGLAFQIRDDMLDVIGSSAEMGKGVGTDEKKNTFVRLYGLKKCEELVSQYTNKAIHALSVFPDSQFLTDLSLSLIERRT